MQNWIKQIALLVIFSAFAYAQNKELILEKLKEKFEGMEHIYIEVGTSKKDVSGFIKAQKGNKYKIVMGDRQITSDGKTVWNYSKQDNQVLISNLEDNYSAGIENIFFELLENVEVIELKKVNSSDSESRFVLRLHDIKKDEYFTLELDSEYNIKALEIDSYSDKWHIIKMNISSTKSNSEFEYSPAEDVEIIDLR